MKLRFWVVAKKTASLRDSINYHLLLDKDRDKQKMKFPVVLMKAKRPERERGWSWVHSRNGGKGSVRYRWNPQLKILECWAVTKKRQIGPLNSLVNS